MNRVSGCMNTAADGQPWLGKSNREVMGHDRIDLLRYINFHGSVSAAAREMGMSFKAALQAVDTMNNLADRPLVERDSGGKANSMTMLTTEGLSMLEMFERVEEEYRVFLERLNESVSGYARLSQLMRRFAMKSSARNQFLGKISRVIRGAVNGEVELDLGNGMRMVSIITNESIEDLGLQTGSEAYALVKASSPILVLEDDEVRTSARNRLCGTVVSCIEGAVNGEVGLELEGNKRLTAICTNESIRALGIKEGVSACALIKASNVIVAVNN